MTIRVYALYQRSRLVLIPLLVLWVGALVVGCVRVLSQWRIVRWLLRRQKVGSVLQ